MVSRNVTIRSSALTHEGSLYACPLFGGALKTLQRNPFLLLSMALYLNPTRAIRFYQIMTTDREGVIETAARPTEPRTLDRSSNCLPAWITREQYLAGERRHFQNVLSELERTCRVAAEMAMLPNVAFRASDFCLNECEVYFEFHRPNAVETLRGLADSLFRFGDRGTKRKHAPRTEANDTETHENGESVKLRLSKTEHLVVYAKTANRLRFEVRFDKPSSNILEGRTSPDLTGFLPKIDTLRERAAKRVNEVLAFLNETEDVPQATIASDWRYHREWFKRLGSNQIAFEFYESLRLNGRLFARQPSEEEKKTIRKAKAAGLVRFVKGRGCYVPCPGVVPGR
jgi:hypothetical protein